jgi:hypothetical protein
MAKKAIWGEKKMKKEQNKATFRSIQGPISGDQLRCIDQRKPQPMFVLQRNGGANFFFSCQGLLVQDQVPDQGCMPILHRHPHPLWRGIKPAALPRQNGN